MRGSSNRMPSLRRHKPSGQAVVARGGKDFYCGPWPLTLRKPPPDVREAMTASSPNGCQTAAASHQYRRRFQISLNELILAFWRYAERHYHNADGVPPNELSDYRTAMAAAVEALEKAQIVLATAVPRMEGEALDPIEKDEAAESGG